MTKTPRGFRLSTGRELDANAHLMCPLDDDDCNLGEVVSGLNHGYDGYVQLEGDEAPLTASERAEIADYFINRWRTWAQQT